MVVVKDSETLLVEAVTDLVGVHELTRKSGAKKALRQRSERAGPGSLRPLRAGRRPSRAGARRAGHLLARSLPVSASTAPAKGPSIKIRQPHFSVSSHPVTVLATTKSTATLHLCPVRAPLNSSTACHRFSSKSPNPRSTRRATFWQLPTEFSLRQPVSTVSAN
jgi:hypothetical protein